MGSCQSYEVANHMTTWPTLENGHITCYFIQRAGFSTQEQLLLWKQMDAFNFFQVGEVRKVLQLHGILTRKPEV